MRQQQDAAAHAFLQHQQHAAAPTPPAAPSQSTISLTVADLQNLIQTVGDNAASKAVQNSQANSSSDSSILPKEIRHMFKPPPFESREKSGKFVNFERNLRQYIKVQNFQPETKIVDEQKCRTIVEVCYTGEAL